MCLPRIDRIESIDGNEAFTTNRSSGPISLLCVPTAQVGDHVMVHAGYAIEVLDPDEAAERRSMVAEVRGERLSPLTGHDEDGR